MSSPQPMTARAPASTPTRNKVLSFIFMLPFHHGARTASSADTLPSQTEDRSWRFAGNAARARGLESPDLLVEALVSSGATLARLLLATFKSGCRGRHLTVRVGRSGGAATLTAELTTQV